MHLATGKEKRGGKEVRTWVGGDRLPRRQKKGSQNRRDSDHIFYGRIFPIAPAFSPARLYGATFPTPVASTHPTTASAGFICPADPAKATETYPPAAPGATTAIASPPAAVIVQCIVSLDPTAKLQAYPSDDAGQASGGGELGGGGGAGRVARETAEAEGAP